MGPERGCTPRAIARGKIVSAGRVGASAAEPVEVHFRWRPQLTDPSDELVLEAAVNGSADRLVTHNVRDFQAAATKFELRVVTPRDFLKEIRR